MNVQGELLNYPGVRIGGGSGGGGDKMSKFYVKVFTVMCLSIGTPKNNKLSICSKWKINYF